MAEILFKLKNSLSQRGTAIELFTFVNVCFAVLAA